jgi:hypothetical protein
MGLGGMQGRRQAGQGTGAHNSSHAEVLCACLGWVFCRCDATHVMLHCCHTYGLRLP